MTVSPSDHAVGVDARTAITVTFDRPMNEASVLASYTSEDLPLSQLDVSWNAERTLLTLVPKTALAYATGSVAPGSTLDFLPKTYRFAFDDRALDGAGHALEAASFSFSTLRAVSSELAADAAHTGNWTDGAGEGVHNCLRAPPRGYVPTVCIGDDSSNVRYTGFISFDLSALPATVQSFSSARLEASGSVNGSLHALGESSLEQVPFGELGAAALTAPATASFGSFFGNTALTAGTHVELAIDVTSAVASDYAREPGAAKLSQYRLAFENIYANGIWDDLELTTSELDLAVTYFVP